MQYQQKYSRIFGVVETKQVITEFIRKKENIEKEFGIWKVEG